MIRAEVAQGQFALEQPGALVVVPLEEAGQRVRLQRAAAHQAASQPAARGAARQRQVLVVLVRQKTQETIYYLISPRN